MEDDSIVTVYSEHDDEYEIYCPYCKTGQAEHPVNILMGEGSFAEHECDKCGEEFTLSCTHIVEYITSK